MLECAEDAPQEQINAAFNLWNLYNRGETAGALNATAGLEFDPITRIGLACFLLVRAPEIADPQTSNDILGTANKLLNIAISDLLPPERLEAGPDTNYIYDRPNPWFGNLMHAIHPNRRGSTQNSLCGMPFLITDPLYIARLQSTGYGLYEFRGFYDDSWQTPPNSEAQQDIRGIAISNQRNPTQIIADWLHAFFDSPYYNPLTYLRMPMGIPAEPNGGLFGPYRLGLALRRMQPEKLEYLELPPDSINSDPRRDAAIDNLLNTFFDNKGLGTVPNLRYFTCASPGVIRMLNRDPAQLKNLEYLDIRSSSNLGDTITERVMNENVETFIDHINKGEFPNLKLYQGYGSQRIMAALHARNQRRVAAKERRNDLPPSPPPDLEGDEDDQYPPENEKKPTNKTKRTSGGEPGDASYIIPAGNKPPTNTWTNAVATNKSDAPSPSWNRGGNNPPTRPSLKN